MDTFSADEWLLFIELDKNLTSEFDDFKKFIKHVMYNEDVHDLPTDYEYKFLGRIKKYLVLDLYEEGKLNEVQRLTQAIVAVWQNCKEIDKPYTDFTELMLFYDLDASLECLNFISSLVRKSCFNNPQDNFDLLEANFHISYNRAIDEAESMLFMYGDFDSLIETLTNRQDDLNVAICNLLVTGRFDLLQYLLKSLKDFALDKDKKSVRWLLKRMLTVSAPQFVTEKVEQGLIRAEDVNNYYELDEYKFFEKLTI